VKKSNLREREFGHLRANPLKIRFISTWPRLKNLGHLKK
jgi:hypothetical protein